MYVFHGHAKPLFSVVHEVQTIEVFCTSRTHTRVAFHFVGCAILRLWDVFFQRIDTPNEHLLTMIQRSHQIDAAERKTAIFPRCYPCIHYIMNAYGFHRYESIFTGLKYIT